MSTSRSTIPLILTGVSEDFVHHFPLFYVDLRKVENASFTCLFFKYILWCLATTVVAVFTLASETARNLTNGRKNLTLTGSQPMKTKSLTINVDYKVFENCSVLGGFILGGFPASEIKITSVSRMKTEHSLPYR
jgi:hypothetical protein